MATSKQFALRRRVTLGGIPVIELRAILSQMPMGGVVRITANVWTPGADGGEWLTSDGNRVPIDLRLSCGKSELFIDVMSDRNEDALFCSQVRNHEWDVSPVETEDFDEDEFELSRIAPQESAAARDSALADYEKERRRQERAERKRTKRTTNI